MERSIKTLNYSMKYLRFFIRPLLISLLILSLLIGSVYLILFYITLGGLFVLGDYFLPKDKRLIAKQDNKHSSLKILMDSM